MLPSRASALSAREDTTIMQDKTQNTVPEAVEAFIARWSKAGGTERANYQLFLPGLARVLIQILLADS